MNTPRTPGAAVAGAVSIAVMRVVRDRRTDEHQVQPVRGIDVGDEACPTRQQRVVAAEPAREPSPARFDRGDVVDEPRQTDLERESRVAQVGVGP